MNGIKLALLCLPMLCMPVWSQEPTETDDPNMLAVVTHKKGLAKGLAHNHFIHAGKYTLKTDRSASLENLSLEITLPVDNLVVDDPQIAASWFPKVEALGIHTEPFSVLKEKDRNKIRKSMLAKNQLHGKDHPQITAVLRGVRVSENKVGSEAFSHVLTMEITIRGTTVTKDVFANLNEKDGRLVIDAYARLSFSAFGIKPYSAMLGALANADRLDLIVHLEID